MKTLLLVAALPMMLFLSSCRQPCSSSNCTGCCDASGSCQLGTTSLACGVSGSTCSACNLGATCNLGQCFGGTGAGGGLGGGTTGGGTGGGTTGGGTTGGGTTGGGTTGGGTTGGGTGGGGGGSGWTSFCQTYFAEYYGLYGRCGAVTSTYLQQYLATYQQYCSQSAPPGLKDGRSTLNQSAIDQCVAALRNATCTTPYTCTIDVLLGTVGVNGNCYDSTDCQSALYCDTTTTCPGRCAPRIAAGQPVGPFQECVKTAFEYNGTCVALVASGQSCAPMGGSTTTLTCAPPATCLPSQLCGTQTLTGLNTPCNSTSSTCAVGLQCVGDVCVPYGTVNAACDSARRCQGGLLCSPANVCVTSTLVGLGGTCDVDRPCDYNVAFCNIAQGSQTGTCVARRGVNGTCDSSSQCQADLVCKGPVGSSVCGPLSMLNEACSYLSSSDVCTSGTYCTATSTMTSGVCANKKGQGASCVEDRECQSYDCLNSMCTRPSCEDPTP